MYFEIEDGHPDITPVGSVMSWREGVLLSFVLHLGLLLLLIFAPNLLAVFPRQEEQANQILEMKRQPEDRTTFVFVQPKLDLRAQRPRQRAEPSDQDRLARSPEPAPSLENPLPRSRGNTSERVERSDQQVARGQGPTPDPSAGEQSPGNQPPGPQVPDNQFRLPEAQSALNLPTPRQQARAGDQGRAPQAGGSLGDSLRNLQRYVERDQFSNPQGGGAEFGPLQFDTKGVEFGPWVRRFIAQVKRNWQIPYAAMTMRGRVVITFNVHKDGRITDITVVGPSPVDAFNNSSFGALASSNPTAPLPPEYPADKAFFTVTFLYNEEPQ